MSNTKIYLVYHKPASRIMIHENNNCIAYYTKDNHKNSLDNLQEFFCEFTCMWYVWKNNLYSEYIGFGHYRRQQMNNIMLKTNYMSFGVSVTNRCFNESLNDLFINRFNNFIFEDFKEYTKLNFDKTSDIYKIYISNINKQKTWYANECYILPWNKFDEMMKFIEGLIQYVDNKYHLDFKYDNYKEFIEKNWISIKNFYILSENEHWLKTGKYRIFAYIIEILIGFYLGFQIETNCHWKI